MIYLQIIALLLVIVFLAFLLSLGAETLSYSFGKNFTGSVILGLITTLPEYMFVVWACIKGEYNVAVGSSVGACSILITLGYGTVILLATSKFAKHSSNNITLGKGTRVDALYLLLTAFIAYILAWEKNGFDLKDGIILIALFLIYVIHHAKEAINHSKTQISTDPKPKPKDIIKAIFYLACGGAGVIILSEPFVDLIIKLAQELGVSAVAVAIIIGPLASEMPEKLTAYITVLRDARLAEMSICNFIGSKVNHNSLLFGFIPIIGLFAHNQSNIHNIITPSFTLMTITTIIVSFNLYLGKLSRWQGFVFTLGYGLIIGFAFLNAN